MSGSNRYLKHKSFCESKAPKLYCFIPSRAETNSSVVYNNFCDTRERAHACHTTIYKNIPFHSPLVW